MEWFEPKLYIGMNEAVQNCDRSIVKFTTRLNDRKMKRICQTKKDYHVNCTLQITNTAQSETTNLEN